MGYKKWTKSAAQLKPDTKYNSVLISKFINSIMWGGKKSIATKIVYDALDIMAKKITDEPPDQVFEKAISNCKPNVEVRSKRVGGSNYQVPMPVNRKRQQTLAMRWIRDAVRSKSGRPFCESLAHELLDAYRREGAAVTTRENIHRMAEANKAFAHFAW